MKATARAHPNIALVKYWGKRDLPLNLPAAGSLSLTLAPLKTETTVHFDAALSEDHVEMNDQVLTRGSKKARIATFLDRVRNLSGTSHFARVVTTNDFPTAAGLASSASGFAALAVAATAAAGLEPTPTELSILARIGSGSAARSLFGGYVEMVPGTLPDGSDCYACQVAPENHWDLRCLIAVTAEGEKALGSTEGMLQTMETSPFYKDWIRSVPTDLDEARHAIAEQDFDHLAIVAERSCLRMHASALAADPGILYWNATTTRLIHRIRKARQDGLQLFFTIDAGPHVKVFCPARERTACETILRQVDGVLDVLSTRPGPGAHLI
ncbi:MAG: diphosphomevalonate decarboxylase [Bradymonadaceae bacterium]